MVYNSTGGFWSHDAVLQMDIWVATTSDSPPHAVSPWQQLQSAYADATGHSPVWPEWTSGFWQCKLRYSNQTQIMAVAQEYVRRKIPLSLMIIDFFRYCATVEGQPALFFTGHISPMVARFSPCSRCYLRLDARIPESGTRRQGSVA